ncbi:hypothetical protein PoB_004999100 [Plakobranchus ocellatus]|uniref:Uncharacterized protein n=1 Tax=Plakobranchus ocellatus TaxID=259542 RepID=A0AAV4BJH6_9GAST|nr:hypothetical protein PoB_004999100 [Plakobranchus ocellatus]
MIKEKEEEEKDMKEKEEEQQQEKQEKEEEEQEEDVSIENPQSSECYTVILLPITKVLGQMSKITHTGKTCQCYIPCQEYCRTIPLRKCQI